MHSINIKICRFIIISNSRTSILKELTCWKTNNWVTNRRLIKIRFNQMDFKCPTKMHFLLQIRYNLIIKILIFNMEIIKLKKDNLSKALIMARMINWILINKFHRRICISLVITLEECWVLGWCSLNLILIVSKDIYSHQIFG